VRRSCEGTTEGGVGVLLEVWTGIFGKGLARSSAEDGGVVRSYGVGGDMRLVMAWDWSGGQTTEFAPTNTRFLPGVAVWIWESVAM